LIRRPYVTESVGCEESSFR